MNKFKLFFLCVGITFLASSLQAFTFVVEKWELYKMVNSIVKELDENYHSENQVKESFSYLQKSLSSLQRNRDKGLVIELAYPLKNRSNDTTPTFKIYGPALKEGYLVHLYSSAGCNGARQNSVMSTGSVVEVTSAPLSDGPYEFHFELQNSVGDLLGCSKSFVPYYVDTTLSR